MNELQKIRQSLLHRLAEIDNEPEKSGNPYRLLPQYTIAENEDGEEVIKVDTEAENCYVMADTGDQHSPHNTWQQYIFIGRYYYKGEPICLGWPSDNEWKMPEELDFGEIKEIRWEDISTDSLQYIADALDAGN